MPAQRWRSQPTHPSHRESLGKVSLSRRKRVWLLQETPKTPLQQHFTKITPWGRVLPSLTQSKENPAKGRNANCSQESVYILAAENLFKERLFEKISFLFCKGIVGKIPPHLTKTLFFLIKRKLGV